MEMQLDKRTSCVSLSPLLLVSLSLSKRADLSDE
jgi:hypothetical protein